LVQGIQHTLHIFLGARLLEFDEAAQDERSTGCVQDNNETQAREGSDQQGFSTNRHQKHPSPFPAPAHSSCLIANIRFSSQLCAHPAGELLLLSCCVGLVCGDEE
jgi:hypothetical protein